MHSGNNLKRTKRLRRRSAKSDAGGLLFEQLMAQYRQAVYSNYLAPCWIGHGPVNELLSSLATVDQPAGVARD